MPNKNFNLTIFISLLVVLGALFSIVGEVYAVSAINVPVGDHTYESLDRLYALGWIDGLGLSSRPLTRIQVARIIGQAIDNINDSETSLVFVDPERIKSVEEILYSLIDEYRTELVRIGYDKFNLEKSTPSFGYKLLDSMTCTKMFASIEDGEELLIENERSMRLKDGLNSRTSILSWFWYKSFIAASIAPSIGLSSSEVNPDLLEGSLNLSFHNFILNIGRTSMWWGPGYHGAMLLSSNAKALDCVRLKNDTPFRLPSFLRKIGLFNIEFFASELEKKRVVPHALFGGMRLEWQPAAFASFGFNHTFQFGGHGMDTPSVIDLLDLSKAGGGEEQTNHLVSVDMRLRCNWLLKLLPLANGCFLYGEYGAEDEAGMTPLYIGFLAGGMVSDLFKIAGLDIRLEYAYTENTVWYNHFKYKTGYTYRGDILGHHMGTNSKDVFCRISKDFFDKFILGVNFDLERNGFSSATVQTKAETQVDLTFPFKDDIDIKLSYRFQLYRNLFHESGNDTVNGAVLLEVKKYF